MTGPTLTLTRTLTTVREDAMTASAATPAPAPGLSADPAANPAANPAALVSGEFGGGKSHRGWLRAMLDQKSAGPAARPAGAGRERA